MMKVLVCDDSITIRKKLGKALQSIIECEVVEAENGMEAIRLYKETIPNLVFMDIVMPEKDGLEAVAEIRLHDQKAKIVMLSSVGTKENLKTALKLGAVDFIQKPWNIERLQEIIEENHKEGV